MAIDIKRGASTADDPRVAARELYDAIHQPGAALTIFYCASSYDLGQLGEALSELFGPDPSVIGCTTAAEITPQGYLEGAITGVSLGGDALRAHVELVDQLSALTLARGEATAERALDGLRRQGVVPRGETCFGFLLVDGMSMQEEALVSSIYSGLHDIELFGGSSGDSVEFRGAHLYYEGRFRSDCALFTLFHTRIPFYVFKTEHFLPSDQKLVITGADPERRIVTEINGVAAGPEYARMVGLDVEELTPLIFATYPVVVRVGDALYVRSIQKVNDDGSLTFFCAIDEGIVLTVARGVDMVRNLEDTLATATRQVGPPQLVLGCDCILRYLEAGQRGSRERIGQLFVENNVIGFATYGEQFNAMHVNQTFTGVAIGGK
ncbi:MAG: FIST N-terminal domain-containing protein [Kofleriaceae bacterium]